MGVRERRRRLRFGLSTVLGYGRRGFFIPYRHAGCLPAPGARPTYRAIEARFRACEPRFAATLALVEAQAETLAGLGGEPAPAPRWSQDWFPRLDAAMAYGLLRARRPARVVEVGSGHSTRFLARARRDAGLDCAITAVDPAPRAALAGLEVALVRKTLQACGTAPFEQLAAGDFLMIDSSHILMPGSDVDLLLCHILPALPAGVVVQIHDVFLPDDYPAEWDWRGYNEQLGVAALIAGGGWQPLFASHYVATRMAARLAESPLGRLPLPEGARESSLWLEKRSDHAGLTAN